MQIGEGDGVMHYSIQNKQKPNESPMNAINEFPCDATFNTW